MKLKQFKPDPRNANKGTDRGRKVVEDSVTKLGAGRSILADKNGVIIAGNKTLEAAQQAGLEDAIVVQTDGSQLVVVQRTDLDLATDAAAKELAIADNRASEIGLEWDAEVLAELNEEIDLSGLFTELELDKLTEGFGDNIENFEPVDPADQARLDQRQEKMPKEIECKCPACGHEFIKQV